MSNDLVGKAYKVARIRSLPRDPNNAYPNVANLPIRVIPDLFWFILDERDPNLYIGAETGDFLTGEH